MKRHLTNVCVLFRTALRVIVMAPLLATRNVGKAAARTMDSIDHKLPGMECWVSK